MVNVTRSRKAGSRCVALGGSEEAPVRQWQWCRALDGDVGEQGIDEQDVGALNGDCKEQDIGSLDGVGGRAGRRQQARRIRAAAALI